MSSKSYFDSLPGIVSAYHLMRFFPFHESFPLKQLFPETFESPFWCISISLKNEDWENYKIRHCMYRLFPHIRQLEIVESLQFNYEIIRELQELNPNHIFSSLEEINDATGSALNAFYSIWKSQLKFPKLKTLQITCSNYFDTHTFGHLIQADIMPNILLLDVSWGFPDFSNALNPIILDSLKMPRGWSLRDTVHQLRPFPEGSIVKKIHITHASSLTFISDFQALQTILKHTHICVELYHLSIVLSADLIHFWSFLSSSQQIFYQTCSISLEYLDHQSNLLPDLKPIVIPRKLKRFELRSFSPEDYNAVLSKLRFQETPRLVYIRGNHSPAEHDHIASLLRDHPNFQQPFHIAFDIYDPIQREAVFGTYKRICAYALIS